MAIMFKDLAIDASDYPNAKVEVEIAFTQSLRVEFDSFFSFAKLYFMVISFLVISMKTFSLWAALGLFSIFCLLLSTYFLSCRNSFPLANFICSIGLVIPCFNWAAFALSQESYSSFNSIRIFSCQVEACLDYLNPFILQVICTFLCQFFSFSNSYRIITAIKSFSANGKCLYWLDSALLYDIGKITYH